MSGNLAFLMQSTLVPPVFLYNGDLDVVVSEDVDRA